MSKKLYCEECKEEIDLIEETTVVVLKRRWNGVEYVIYESTDTGEPPISICSKCGMPLEDRNAKPLSEMQGELGSNEGISAEELAFDDTDDDGLSE